MSQTHDSNTAFYACRSTTKAGIGKVSVPIQGGPMKSETISELSYLKSY